jgi:superfamily I DNA/RNA helicase
VFADVLDRYIGFCAARGVLDFDLLLKEATELLRSNDAVRAAFQHQTKALFVDETQDMNNPPVRTAEADGGRRS